MRLFIAEKPSVAQAIAHVLGINKNENGYIQCGYDKVTWCLGHMFEQVDPDLYMAEDIPHHPIHGKKLWRENDLPIIPKNWILQPYETAKTQLKIIGQLLKEATQIVHAGDPDREGQLLIDDVLEHFDCHHAVLRLWICAQDAISIRRGLAKLKDNNNYRGFGNAAQARRRADWLIGMNLSRAYTLRAHRGGSVALLTVGRVQTPTLAMVVERDRAIAAFKSAPYHLIKAVFKHGETLFLGHWCAQDRQHGFDDQGRFVDTDQADRLIALMTNHVAQVVDCQQVLKIKPPPCVVSLSDLTLIGSDQFGLSAEAVLESCQSLYEKHKLISYPRTDCCYLPESQHADAPHILDALKCVCPDFAHLIDRANPSLKSKTWDDTKLTAHHGIVPTMHKGNIMTLSDQERSIYHLIVRSYVAQFYLPHEYCTTSAVIDVAGERFEANARVVTCSGWYEVYTEPKEDDHNEDQEYKTLPLMKQGDAVQCIKVLRQDLKTKPPRQFTEGTLVRAMKTIHQLVTDPAQKKLLREGDGIGTSATRASIISELKQHQFLESKDKYIVSTTLGSTLIDGLPEMLTSPVLTALYERLLFEIEQGTLDVDRFIQKQELFVRDQVAQANKGVLKISGIKSVRQISENYHCLSCGKGLVHKAIQKPKRRFKTNFWSCSGYPLCRQTYPDIKGQPKYTH